MQVVSELCTQFADESAVRRSLVFPFQILTLVEVLTQGKVLAQKPALK